MRSPRWLVLLLLVGIAWLLALKLGQDLNWDLRNYHLYNPHALLSGRGSIDWMPAQLQSWYNPLLDVPFYLLATTPISGIWATLWLVLPVGVCVWLGLGIQDRISRTRPTLLQRFVAAALMFGGAAAYSQIGTTFNEWQVGVGVMLALLLTIDALSQRVPPMRLILLAGLAAGGACGLKLTVASHCLALALMCLLGAPRGHRIRVLAMLALGGLYGFLLLGGFWFAAVYAETGNPVFPYYNDIFRSPLASPDRYVYPLYLPQDLGDALRVVVRIARGGVIYGERNVRDPRLLIGVIGCAMALPWMLRILWKRDQAADLRLALLAVFLLASFATWVLMHSIYRYAIVLELVAVVGAVSMVARARRLVRGSVLVLGLLVIARWTVTADWGRSDFTTPFAHNAWPELPTGSVVLTLEDSPLGYAVLGLSDDVPVLSLSNNVYLPGFCSPAIRSALDRTAHADNVWAILEAPEARIDGQRAAATYGLEPTGPCRQVESTLAPFWLCPAHYRGSSVCVD